MAFVNRSKRESTWIASPTTKSLGPGSYFQNNQNGIINSQDTTDFKPNRLKQSNHFSQAPFWSTTKREIGDGKGTREKLGPGCYHREPKTQKMLAASTVFKSTSSRFDSLENISANVGPGHYHVESYGSIQEKTKKSVKSASMAERNKSPNRELLRQSFTAPSIPSHDFANGYEEGRRGELIAQKNPELRHSGTHSDTLGPGEYNVEIEPGYYHRMTKKGTSSFKSTVVRDPYQGFINKDAPPPTKYFAEEAPKPEIEQKKQSSMFLSSTDRVDFAKEKSFVPPPAKYFIESSDFKSTYVPPDLQFFGSSVKRASIIEQKQSTAQLNPGPGAYKLEDISQKLKLSLPSTHGPFATTAPRFVAPQEKIPPVGIYKISGFTEEVKQKANIGRYGIFGTTSKRFNRDVSKVPGVGTYEADKEIKFMKKKDQRSFMFQSKTDRSPPNGRYNNDIPPVGSYNLKSEMKNSHEEGAPVVDAPFLSTSPRFEAPLYKYVEREKASIPGPGKYNTVNLPKEKSIPFTKQVRFKPIAESYVGPGAYETLPNTNWVKPSFNITIAGAV